MPGAGGQEVRHEAQCAALLTCFPPKMLPNCCRLHLAPRRGPPPSDIPPAKTRPQTQRLSAPPAAPSSPRAARGARQVPECVLGRSQRRPCGQARCRPSRGGSRSAHARAGQARAAGGGGAGAAGRRATAAAVQAPAGSRAGQAGFCTPRHNSCPPLAAQPCLAHSILHGRPRAEQQAQRANRTLHAGMNPPPTSAACASAPAHLPPASQCPQSWL